MGSHSMLYHKVCLSNRAIYPCGVALTIIGLVYARNFHRIDESVRRSGLMLGRTFSDAGSFERYTMSPSNVTQLRTPISSLPTVPSDAHNGLSVESSRGLSFSLFLRAITRRSHSRQASCSKATARSHGTACARTSYSSCTPK
jgi:hypothetical protein